MRLPFFGKSDRERALELFDAGRAGEALEFARERLARRPDDPDALIAAGSILFLQGQPGDAKELLSKALEHPLTPEQAHGLVQVTNYRRLSSESEFNTQPSFSRDGKWVIFACARRDTSGDGRVGPEDRTAIHAVNIASGVRLELISDRFYNSQPVFSPDGHKIAFLSAREDSNGDGKIDHNDRPGLYLKDLDSLKEEPLIGPERRPKFPSFSPDGQWLAFCAWNAARGVFGVYLLNLKTRAEWPVQTDFECNFPSFSPDGRRVLYASWRRDTNGDGRIDLHDNSSLCWTDLASSKERELVSDRSSNSYPAFSPDGGSILYLSRRRDTNGDGAIDSLDNSGLYLLNPEKGSERTLVGDEHYVKFPSFSHDGSRIAFIAALSSHDEPEDGDKKPGYFQHKGLYCCGPAGGNLKEILSPRFYGCRFLATSPREDRVVFTAWRKNTGRGLYVAPLSGLPDRAELKAVLQDNL